MMIMVDPETATIAPEWIRRLSRSEYRKMGDAGFFAHERVELLYGQVVLMSPADPSHEHACWTIGEQLRNLLRDRAAVRNGHSFAATDDSEPVPDIVVTPRAAYWDDHPSTAYLVVEVSRTSLRKDRGVKARLYGSVAVQEYWVVDIDGGCVHVLREPDGNGGWRSHHVARRGDVLAVEAFADVTIAVERILPPR